MLVFNISKLAEILKSALGSQKADHDYIYRIPIAEKRSGKSVRRYKYLFAWEQIKKPFEKLAEFFGIKEKQVDEMYIKENIQKDFNADRKTFAQHLVEYFSHRKQWDDRFAPKENQQKFNKPVKMATFKENADVLSKDMETPAPENDEPSLFSDKELKKLGAKDKGEWKANPYLMRRIWGMYTGKTIQQQEKQEQAAEKKVADEAAKKEEQKKLIAEFAEKHNLDPKKVEAGMKQAFKEIDNIWKKTEKKPTKAQLLKDVIKPQLFDLGIIPHSQIEATNTEQIDNVKALLETIASMPKLGDGKYEAKLHYFVGGMDYYITELGENGEAYGYVDNNGDPQMSEWGYIDLKELASVGDAKGLNIDYFFKPKLVGELIKESGHNELYEHYSDVFGEEEGKQKKENKETTDKPKKVDWYEAFAGSWNSFYPSGTGLKPYAARTIINSKGERVQISQRATSKTDINGLLDNFNDFVFNATGIGEKSRQNFLKRLAEQGFHVQKEYTDEKGETKYMLMIRDGSKAGLVEMIPNLENGKKEFTVITYDEAGNEIYKQVFSDIDSAQAFMDKQRKALEAGESEAEKHENRSNAMLGNQNAKKFGMPEDVYEIMRNMVSEQVNGQGIKNRQILFEKLYKKDDYFRKKLDMYGGTSNEEITGYKRSDIFNALYDDVTGGEHGENNADIGRNGISTGIENIRNGRSEETSDSDVYSAGGGDNGDKPDFMPTESRRGLGEPDSDVDRGRGRITKGQARKIREQCREILKKPDDKITEEDKAVLSQYVGAGGTDEEGSSNSGVLYEYYTPRNVISKVWELVDKYNPKQDKTVIEPSSGIGRFAEGRSEKFTMFELEEDSARIAHLLHPDAEIVQGAFQENFMKQKKGRFTKDFEKYDVAVGNPPYGAYTGKYKGMGEGKDYKRYESYFMSRTLDTVKDGGIMAMVVPSGFLNGGSAYGKDLEKIAEKAELLEAWRLPNGTFDSTDVGTDIVVFRKGKGTTVDSFKNYFTNNPDHIAGEIATRIGRFGEETYIKPKDGETFESAVEKIEVGQVEFDEAVEKVAENISVKTKKEEGQPITAKTVFGDVVKLPDGKVGKVNGYIQRNRKTIGFYVNVDGKSEEFLLTDEQIKENDSGKEKTGNRSEAMKGNKNADGEHDYPIDPNAHLMDAAEFNSKYGKNVDPKDIPIWKVTDKYGNIDMTKLSDTEKKYVETSDHYVKDGGVYVNKVNFASGNVRKKLKGLDPNDPEFEVKKALLESVMPKEKGLLRTWKEIDENGNEIEKSDGFTLSPITDWTREYRTKDGKDLISGFFEWAYAGNRYYNASESPISRSEIPAILEFGDIEEFIHKQALKLDRGEANTDDKKGKQRYREQKKQLRRDTAIKLFNRYLSEGLSIDDQKDLVEAWNDKANSFVNPDYTKIPLFVDNMSTHKGKKKFNLLPQQLKGISMLCNKGTGLLAYDVGVGKTACGIVATVNQIQTGRSKRPVICVPKPVYKNWIKSIHELFPDIKVNELGNLSKNYWTDGMKIEDGSISVCTYEGLENIGFNEQEEEEIQEDVEFGAMQSTGEKSKRQKASDSEKSAETVGGMVKTRDEGVAFSDLGFDHITVDEVHNFRNLFKMPRHMNKKGESEQGESNEFDGLGSGGEPSNRAMKLFAITQLIQRHNDGRNTFLLSATPFQNSPTEVYSILSYMARDKLKEQGFYSLEQFISNFCKVQREYVVKANRVVESPVVKGFENLTELQGLLTSYMDKVDGEEAGVVRPYKRTHAPELELSSLQKAIMDECSAYIEEQETLPKEERDDGYMFRAMNAMKFCALSPALVSPEFIPVGYDVPPISQLVESSPKLKFVCDSIIEQYKKAPKHGQIMYMPIGVEQHPLVKNYLIRNGIPKEAIEIMPKGSSEKNLDRREEIKNDFNDIDGKCKILIGGQDIKEGVTLNGNTTTIYCTQLDWNPTDVQQLWGRGWRQGNKQGIVHCVAPLMHDSLDPMIYQKHDEKSSRTDDLYSYKGDTMNANDINPEELKFALIKDPNKRADLQVMEFTEKNKSDQKMYGQLIDVLHKQIDVAFRSDKDLELEAQSGMIWSGIEGEEKEIERYRQEKQKIKDFAAKLKKDYKGKESSFNAAEVIAEYNSISSGWAVSRYNNFETFLQNMDKDIARADDNIASAKGRLSTYNKNLKKLQEQRKSCLAYLASKGMKTQADCESKIQDYVKLMDECKNNVDKAKDMRAKFYEEAVAYNKANEKNLLSVDELVKQNVDSIMNDLHPMDEEFKAKIKAENDRRFGRDVQKSFEYVFVTELSKSIDEKQRAFIAAEKKVKELENGNDEYVLNVAKSEVRMARAALEDLQKSLFEAESTLRKSETAERVRRNVGYIDIVKSFTSLADRKDKPLYIMKDGRFLIKEA